MKRFVFFLGFAVIALNPAKAEAGWSRTYGGEHPDAGFRILETNDGGYVVAAITSSFGNGSTDIWLLRIDSLGDTLWTKTYGREKSEIVSWMGPTEDGGWIIAAESKSFVSYYFGIWLLKTDSLGDTLWTTLYYTDGVNETSGYVGSAFFDSGYVAIGGINYPDSNKIVFLKIDEKGKIEWVKEHDGAYSCANATRDSLYLVVSNNNVMLFAELAGEIFEWKHESAWNVQWIEQAQDKGSYVMAGTWPDVFEGPVFWISKGSIGFGEQGYFKQTKNGGWSYRINLTSDGGYISTGDPWAIVKSVDNDSLDTVWTKKYLGKYTCYGKDVLQTKDGGYIVVGEKDRDVWLFKTDSNCDTLGVSEPSSSSPATHQPSSEIEIASSIGSEIVIYYSNCPDGFSASVYDAGGRRVDEIVTSSSSGQIEWGARFPEGVYFIKTNGSKSQTAKIVLIR